MSTIRKRRALLAATVVVLSVFAPAQTRVAICAAASTATDDCRFTDPQAKLLGTGAFAAVDIINVTATGQGTPGLTQLLGYDALLVWTNASPADNAALGDVLADYVDAGGGVVVAVFANSTADVARNIAGRWQAGYEVILDQSGTSTGLALLGDVALPAHPVMADVEYFSGGSSAHRPSGTALAPGAKLIASWSDGLVLAAQGANARRVDLGLYPPSSDCFASSWDANSDGAKLMANALLFVAGQNCGASVVTYCTSGTSANGCSATISASGSPSASASSGFTLHVTQLEGLKQGILFYGINNLGFTPSPWANGSSSYLCIKHPTQRMGVQNSGGTFAQCNGSLSVDWNTYIAHHPSALGQPFAGGETVWAQAWFRDPPSPKTTSLSNALSFIVCPP